MCPQNPSQASEPMTIKRRPKLRLIAGAASGRSIDGCVTVKTPDKPIEINLKSKSGRKSWFVSSRMLSS